MKACRPLVSRDGAVCALVGVALLLASSCVGRADDLGATGSETHFLIECTESCAAGLECLGGVCTSACASDASCATWSEAAVCSAGPADTELGTCDVQCDVAADCAPLGSGYRCQQGFCRSATAVGVESAAASLPPFEVLELRRLLPTEPLAGSECDPRDASGVYFVDLRSRQVSWSFCEDEGRSRIFERTTGQWPLADADRDDVLAAYGQLQVGVSEPCLGDGGSLLDVTTADSARYTYGDDSFEPCDVRRLGRVPVGNLSPFYTTIAPLFYDRPRGLPREEPTDR